MNVVDFNDNGNHWGWAAMLQAMCNETVAATTASGKGHNHQLEIWSASHHLLNKAEEDLTCKQEAARGWQYIGVI